MRIIFMEVGSWKMKEGAVELPGIHPNTLRKRMDKLGIHYRRQARSLS